MERGLRVREGVGLVGGDLRAKRYGAKGFLFYFAVYGSFNFFGPSGASQFNFRVGIFRKACWIKFPEIGNPNF